jgi:hypothetical protein
MAVSGIPIVGATGENTGKATAHAGLGDRNIEMEPVKQVHGPHVSRADGACPPLTPRRSRPSCIPW